MDPCVCDSDGRLWIKNIFPLNNTEQKRSCSYYNMCGLRRKIRGAIHYSSTDPCTFQMHVTINKDYGLDMTALQNHHKNSVNKYTHTHAHKF